MSPQNMFFDQVHYNIWAGGTRVLFSLRRTEMSRSAADNRLLIFQQRFMVAQKRFHSQFENLSAVPGLHAQTVDPRRLTCEVSEHTLQSEHTHDFNVNV